MQSHQADSIGEHATLREVLMRKMIAALSASACLAGLALAAGATPAAADDTRAPSANWTGTVYSRAESPRKGEIKFRFRNDPRTGRLELGVFEASLPYQCEGGERKQFDFEWDEREDDGVARVDTEFDYGVKLIVFRFEAKQGNRLVWAVGQAKLNFAASSRFEPDASGRIRSTAPGCRTNGGAGLPMGFVADRNEIRPTAARR